MSRPLSVRRVAKLRKIIRNKAKAGKLYSRVHADTAEFIKITPVGVEVELEGKKYVVRDNFTGRVAFKEKVAIDRYELKEIRPEKALR